MDKYLDWHGGTLSLAKLLHSDCRFRSIYHERITAILITCNQYFCTGHWNSTIDYTLLFEHLFTNCRCIVVHQLPEILEICSKCKLVCLIARNLRISGIFYPILPIFSQFVVMKNSSLFHCSDKAMCRPINVCQIN